MIQPSTHQLSVRSRRARVRVTAIGVLVALAALLVSTTATSTRSSAAQSANGTWNLRASLPAALSEIGVAEAGGRVYVLGGIGANGRVNTTYAYSPATGSWATLPSFPGPALDHPGAASVNGVIYVVGGLTGWPGPAVDTVYVYSPSTNSWSSRAPMPRARGAMGVAVLNGKLYAVGGLANGVAVNDLTVYDPATNNWATLASMPTARDHLVAEAVNGKLYAIGGRNGDIGQETAATEVYDPATNSWASLPPMPTARGGHGSGVLHGRIIVFGGEGNRSSSSGVFSQTEELDPVSNTWRTLSPMAQPRHGMDGAPVDGHLYVPGGGPAEAYSFSSTHQSFTIEASAPPTPTSTSAADSGLTGRYYNGRDFNSLAFTRVDQAINFNWGSGSPGPGVGSDNFSVRWTGQVRADHSETYTFYTTSNDGVRLWVDGQLLVNDWTEHPATENAGSIALQAGQWYSLTLEYFEGAGTSLIQLAYSSPSTAKQIIPSSKLRRSGASQPTPTPTRPPAATPTATPVPATCTPRPPVGVSTVRDGPGQLRVTITANLAADAPNNTLRELRFGEATNAVIDVSNGPSGGGSFTHRITGGVREVVFFVRRATAGQATTVRLTVVDQCGDWPTLVGGGPNAF